MDSKNIYISAKVRAFHILLGFLQILETLKQEA